MASGVELHMQLSKGAVDEASKSITINMLTYKLASYIHG